MSTSRIPEEAPPHPPFPAPPAPPPRALSFKKPLIGHPLHATRVPGLVGLPTLLGTLCFLLSPPTALWAARLLTGCGLPPPEPPGGLTHSRLRARHSPSAFHYQVSTGPRTGPTLGQICRINTGEEENCRISELSEALQSNSDLTQHWQFEERVSRRLEKPVMELCDRTLGGGPSPWSCAHKTRLERLESHSYGDCFWVRR